MSSSTSSRALKRFYAVLPVGLAIVIALLVVNWSLHGRYASEPPLKAYGAVPPFSLTERSGKKITNQDLAGKIWVADFIFTTCPGPCPIISANMAHLQSQLSGDPRVQLVSFTVDPQDDTPAVLSAYADRLGADPQRWWFLTGPEKSVYDLIQNGFYQTVQDNHGKKLEAGQFVVTHSTYMALIDGRGTIRGFYQGLEADDQSQLLKSIHQLEEE
jgi:cytochrome oxidase Cu insertion factor (SCO1/SenC/PrrC family)